VDNREAIWEALKASLKQQQPSLEWDELPRTEKEGPTQFSIFIHRQSGEVTIDINPDGIEVYTDASIDNPKCVFFEDPTIVNDLEIALRSFGVQVNLSDF
jgi:hypothetical protein